MGDSATPSGIQQHFSPYIDTS